MNKHLHYPRYIVRSRLRSDLVVHNRIQHNIDWPPLGSMLSLTDADVSHVGDIATRQTFAVTGSTGGRVCRTEVLAWDRVAVDATTDKVVLTAAAPWSVQ